MVVSLSRLLRYAVLVNASLGAFFAWCSYAQWSLFNHYSYTASTWGPISILMTPVAVNNGTIVHYTEILDSLNYPFILFWVSTATNLIFIYKLSNRGKNIDSTDNKKR